MANSPKPNPFEQAVEERERDAAMALMRQDLSRVTAQLAKEKIRTEELVSACYRACRESASSLVLPTLAPPKPPRKSSQSEEWCVPLLSDLQLGKLTRSYNSDICEQRVANYAEKIVSLTENHRQSRPVRNCHVVMLGDMVEGETIFPGQHWLIDSSLFHQATVNGPRICINFLLRMLATFEHVEVTMVDGNHGIEGGLRSGKHHPATNSDRMMYQFIKTIFDYQPQYKDRIRFNLASDKHETEKNWWAIVEIGSYRALAIHGYEIRGNGPWHGLTLAKKVNSWAAGGIREPFHDMFMGHYHQVGMIPLNRRKVYVNGSTESDNDFASQVIGAQSDPKQWTLFVSPKKGRVTASYDVDLLDAG